MARADLLALEPEDLAVLSNRGIVKRAQAEVDSGDYTCEIQEADGAVTVRWSDDVECLIPAGKGLADGRCSCPATTLCRHLVRSVLAYQRAGKGSVPAAEVAVSDAAPAETLQSDEAHADEAHAGAPPAPAPAAAALREPWDPGAIPDEELERHYRAADLARARRQLEDGQVIELVRGVKPSAYLHTLSLNVRFLVPGSVAYTHCDCAEARPCSHVPLAVWGFRILAPELRSGLVSTRREALPVPEELFGEIERALVELAQTGVQSAPRPLADRFRRLESRCRDEGLAWPAEILAELVQQQEAYWSHDARFSPRRVAELAGELCIRMDAIRADTGAVPQLFIRGSRADRTTDVGRAQMVGLGCGVSVRRGGVELSAFLQDDRSGAVVAVCREFTDPAPESPDPPKEFWQLAQASPITGISFAGLGSGRLQIEGGKRTPSSRFIAGRSRASLTPHTLQWEKQVRPPVLAEDFGELAARLAGQPPASLRPRRIGSRLHVCAVAGVEGVQFSDSDQTIYAALKDASGATALLAHRYSSRAHHGSERLLSRLRRHGEGLRFVAAEVSLAGAGLLLRPIAAVFEVDGARTLVQPWIDGPSGAEESGAQRHSETLSEERDPIGHFADELLDAAGEQWLLGLNRADSHAARSWDQVRGRGSGLGFHRLLAPVERIGVELEQRARTLRWDPTPAAVALLEVGVVASVAAERAAVGR